jgi:hypothetical protein
MPKPADPDNSAAATASGKHRQMMRRARNAAATFRDGEATLTSSSLLVASFYAFRDELSRMPSVPRAGQRANVTRREGQRGLRTRVGRRLPSSGLPSTGLLVLAMSQSAVKRFIGTAERAALSFGSRTRTRVGVTDGSSASCRASAFPCRRPRCGRSSPIMVCRLRRGEMSSHGETFCASTRRRRSPVISSPSRPPGSSGSTCFSSSRLSAVVSNSWPARQTQPAPGSRSRRATC